MNKKVASICLLSLALSAVPPSAITQNNEPIRTPQREGRIQVDTPQHEKQGSNNSNPIPWIIGGAIITAIVGGILMGRQKSNLLNEEMLPDELRKQGPQFPPIFRTNTFSAVGFARGGWPLVIEMNLKQPGTARLEVSVHDSEPQSYRITDLGRRIHTFKLPDRFGNQPKPAVFNVQATSEVYGRTVPADFDIYGLGCGPRAVGSVAIDKLEFGPSAVNPRAREVAEYRFFSHSDFGKTAVDILKYQPKEKGIETAKVATQSIAGGVSAGQAYGPGLWDGTGSNKQISIGLHQLLVRAWNDDLKQSDWVASLSYELVNVVR